MGKLNEIQEQMTQSYGDNAFTTTIKDDTVEFDSLKDKFTFADEVEVPSLKVNGESVSSQVQADWNQNDSEAVDYIKNKPTIPEAQVQADWNQNDSESSDYIKNRICYDGEIISKLVGAETEVSSNYGYFNFKNIPIGNRTGESSQTGCFNEIVIDKLTNGSFVRQTREITYGGSYNSDYGIVSYSSSWGKIEYNPDGFGSSHPENGRFTNNDGTYKVNLVKTVFSFFVSSASNQFNSPLYSTPIESGKKYHIIRWNSSNYQIIDEYDVTARAPYSFVQLDINSSGAYLGYSENYFGGKDWAFGGFTDESSYGGYIIQEYVDYVEQIDDKYISSNIARASQLGGAQFKVENTTLKVSLDGGTTWLTVSAS